MIVNHTSRLLGERRMSIAAAARKANLAYTTVHDLYHLKGARVGWDTLDAMCRALDLASISELIEYVPEDASPRSAAGRPGPGEGE